MAEVAQRYGPYTCVRRLGAGGMAETFLAVQQGAAGFEQRVCMKFILPAYRNDPSFRQMFLREATIAASLRHTNIVGVIDLDAEDGYIVLELVDGVDLRTLIMATRERRLTPSLVALIAIELLKALAYSHGRMRRGKPDGIVHRDISPSNVMISHSGEVKLTDFGVAKAMRSNGEPASTSIKGKLCYMSPEQARGEPLDGRADLFSLGVMLFELLSGARPFDGPNDAQTLMRIDAGLHPPLLDAAPDVPPGLALIVERLLRRQPDERFDSADDCIDALAAYAPPITSYRELGQLARTARAPETLSTGDFLVTPASGQRPLERYSRTTRPAAAERRPARWDRTLRDVTHELQPAGTASMSERVPPPSGRRRGTAGVSRSAWLALAGSLFMAATVALGWLWRGSWPALQTTLQPASAQPPAAAPKVAEPAVVQAALPVLQDPRVAPLLPEPRTRPTAPLEASRSAPAKPLASGAAAAKVAKPTPEMDAPATLRVGTMPLGQVWIDGELAGWAPVTRTIAPGTHTIEGGNTRPEIKRSVRLRAGETKQVVISLEDEHERESSRSAGEIGASARPR